MTNEEGPRPGKETRSDGTNAEASSPKGTTVSWVDRRGPRYDEYLAHCKSLGSYEHKPKYEEWLDGHLTRPGFPLPQPPKPVVPVPEVKDEKNEDAGHRIVSFTRASDIKPRPVHWLWEDRVALGTLALLAGREGIGKSTIAYDIAARITKGQLPGAYKGEPKSVAVVASEDSWSHTIVPRLMGADADLERVLRVDVVTSEGLEGSISLPQDIRALEKLLGDEGVALILLDPLMSRLGNLDTHKDSEVRQALEPLVALANRSKCAMLGLIHLNKSGSNDPLSLIMGSRAFAAVARAVLFAMNDEEAGKRYLGQPKNNLGRVDLPSLEYSIQSAHVADTEDGPILTGKVIWGGEVDQSIRELLEATGEAAEAVTATAEAGIWLVEYLTSVGGTSASSKIKLEGKAAGHSESALKKARIKKKIGTESSGFPRQTFWFLPRPQSGQDSQSTPWGE